MADNPQVFHEYAAILQRRKIHFTVPAVLILMAAIVLAFTLPPIYRATATIIIERPQVPANMVASSVTGYAIADTCDKPTGYGLRQHMGNGTGL